MSTTPTGASSSGGAAGANNPNSGKKAVHVKVSVDSCFRVIVDSYDRCCFGLSFRYIFDFDLSVMVILVRTKQTSQKRTWHYIGHRDCKTWSV